MDTQLAPPNFYQPSELLGIFKNVLSGVRASAALVSLRGIFVKSEKLYGRDYYDHLRDETTSDEMVIVTPATLREGLSSGNLITVSGTIDFKPERGGRVGLMIRVTRVEKERERVVTADDIWRQELRDKKQGAVKKNVGIVLENELYLGRRPKVELIFAEGSITAADFYKGLGAARSSIDFSEHRVNFARSGELCAELRRIDAMRSHVVVLIRGGGGGLESLDNIAVAETLVALNTPWICGVGHENDKVFIRELADMSIAVPFAVGDYFKKMVESVSERRSESRAALRQDLEKEYKGKIEKMEKERQEIISSQEQKIGELNANVAKLNKTIVRQTIAIAAAVATSLFLLAAILL